MDGLVVIIIVVIASTIAFKVYARKKRREFLLKKYGDLSLANRLLDKIIWQGETSEQLFDSLGRPLDVDQKVLKSKTKETWKYNATGKNRYGMKIFLEDGVVVGWDKKD